ncbi:hypothetical protein PIB30_016612 [Stylosanthes scabra]|uniref:Uncharacterized protein n=1 Tax=Stylosanthes scabra TaxID=79078 RepID=A0ABU6U6C0_9FABA|nr:hypothetical protein [Stylosanthes scabra]
MIAILASSLESQRPSRQFSALSHQKSQKEGILLSVTKAVHDRLCIQVATTTDWAYGGNSSMEKGRHREFLVQGTPNKELHLWENGQFPELAPNFLPLIGGWTEVYWGMHELEGYPISRAYLIFPASGSSPGKTICTICNWNLQNIAPNITSSSLNS